MQDNLGLRVLRSQPLLNEKRGQDGSKEKRAWKVVAASSLEAEAEAVSCFRARMEFKVA